MRDADDERTIDRRALIVSGAALLAAAPLGAAKAPAIDPDEGVTAPEDLMKEHGVLNRCLLVYEEGLRRLAGKSEVPPEVFQHTADLVRTFVEEYHERNEEKYIFPEFEKARKLVDLVALLRTQHVAGRRVTAEILRLSQPAAFRLSANRDRLAAACTAFIRMYRPHEAREDTVLFPALRTILAPQQVAALGDRMEEDEQKVLGKEGFERNVDRVAALEKQLGIYELAQFTPK
ncbi:MAG TPA: hemerythrin domain-containing protein [Thermoanaerobaculia bacterium]